MPKVLPLSAAGDFQFCPESRHHVIRSGAIAWIVYSDGVEWRRCIPAFAGMTPPVLMLFDEPTSALDPELVGEVLEVIRALARDGMTMLVVPHEMQFAREVGSRVLFMDGGRILEDAEPATFFRQPDHPRAREFLRRRHVPAGQ